MRRLLMILLLLAGGCEDQPDPPTPARAAETPPPAAPVWQTRDGSEVAAVRAEDAEAVLAAAISQARATASGARERWTGSGETERGRWAVKWEAETLDGGTEHLWVRPTAWTAFRIEGRLASPPQRELLCGAEVGDVVAFPIEALSDWLYEPADAPREGGYTTAALEREGGP